MVIFLASVLILLLAGAPLSYILARRESGRALMAATTVVTIVLAIWLLAGRYLPLTFSLVKWAPASPLSQWTLIVDSMAWQMSLYLLLLVEALLLTRPAVDLSSASMAQTNLRNLALPSILLATAAGLLAFWSASIPGLLSSWTLLALVWLFLLWISSEGQANLTELLLRTGAMMIGVVFLWLAAATFDTPEQLALGAKSWPAQSIMWALLAVLTQLGAVPLHWWRPLSWTPPPSMAALLHLVPAAAGASLLVRLAPFSSVGTVSATLMTVFGLLGLLAGASLAWLHHDQPNRAVAGLVLSQVGLIVLLGSWLGPEPVLAGSRVMILALGGLFLFSDAPKQRFSWYAVVPIAALAGLPLTAGFLGLAPLYTAWLDAGLVILAIVTGLLFIPIIAAAVLISWRAKGDREEKSLATGVRIRFIIGLLLPTLGLLALPSLPLSAIPWLTWLIIVVIAAGGVVLSSYDERIREIQPRFHRAIPIEVPELRARELLASAGRGVGVAIREVATVLEGEGGMLWLLVMVIVVWLALRG